MRDSAKSCINIPQVKVTRVDQNGKTITELQDSKLFLDLQKKFPRQRNKQVQLWGIATDEKFINYVKANFPEYFAGGKGVTEQGEINLPTLLELVGEKEFVRSDAMQQKILQEEFDATEFDDTEEGFAAGINQVARFNEHNDYRGVYKAQLVTDNGKYRIRLVKFSTMKRENKAFFIRDSIRETLKQTARQRILRILADNGVNVRYVDKRMSETLDRMDPLNPNMTAVEAGYRAYLGIKEGSNDTHFYIRAGLFALYSLGDKNHAVNRLINIVTENEAIVKYVMDVIRKEDKDFFDEISNRPDKEMVYASQEVAVAYLIGRRLQSNAENIFEQIPVVGSFSRLFGIIITGTERFLSLFMEKENRQQIKSRYYADKIAKSLLEGEMGDAVANKEAAISRITDTELAPEIHQARAARKEIKKMIESSKQTGTTGLVKAKNFRELDDILTNMANLKNLSKEDVKSHSLYYKKRVLVSLSELLDMLEDPEKGLINEQLVSDIKSTHEFGESMQIFGDKIKAAEGMVRMMLQVMDWLDMDGSAAEDKEFEKNLNIMKRDLEKIQKNIKTSTDIIAARFLSDVIGADYISVTLGKKFFGKSVTKESLGKNLGLEIVDKEKWQYEVVKGQKVVIPVKALLHNTSDIGWLDKSIVSMGRVKDVTLQMIDVYNRKRQAKVRQKSIDTNRELTQLYEYARKHNVDMEAFFELNMDGNEDEWRTGKSDKNKLTGNFVAEVNWDVYDKQVSAFRKRAWDLYVKENPNVAIEDNAQYSLNARYEWQKFWQDALEAWNIGLIDGHAHAWKYERFDDEGNLVESEWIPYTHSTPGPNTVFPKEFYDNYRYVELFGKEGSRTEQQLHNYNVYSRIIEMKKKLDKECLDYGATKWYRAPQFKGIMTNQMRNRATIGGSVDTLLKFGVQRFMDDSDALDFGDDMNHSPNGDDDPFNTQRYASRHIMDRVPLYGINKLRDVQTMSTDPIHSMMAYAYMAENYKATKDTISTLELYHDVVSGKTQQEQKFVTPRKQEKLEEYFRANFYGSGMKPWIVRADTFAYNMNKRMRMLNTRYGIKVYDKLQFKATDFIVTEAVKLLNSCTSLLFLGGNLHSATLNTLSGIVRLGAESIKGENFTFWELQKATMIWIWDSLVNVVMKGKLGVTGMATDLAKNSKYYQGRVLDYTTPQSKLALFKEKFDIKNDYQTEARNRNEKSLGQAATDLLMIGYEIGDDFMSTVGYVAAAMHTKVIDRDGKKISLWKAMTRVEVEDGVYKLEIDDRIFKDWKTRARWDYADDLLGRIEVNIAAAPGNTEREQELNVNLYYLLNLLNKADRPFGNDGKKNPFEHAAIINYLKAEHAITVNADDGITVEAINDVRGLRNALEKYRDKQTFGEADWDRFRYIGNLANVGMHGVYNSTDKAWLQNTIIGCMISTLKGYFFGYMQREMLGMRVDVGSGKPLTFEEYAEKYGLYAEDVDKETIKQQGALIYGDNAEFNNLIGGSEVKDMINNMILDTDLHEGTMVSCIKLFTNMLNDRNAWAIFAYSAVNAATFWLPNKRIRDNYMSWGEGLGYSKEQLNNFTREWGMKMIVGVMSVLRTLLAAMVPPPEEDESQYLDRLVDLVDKLNANEDESLLTKRERELKKAITIPRQPDWDDHRYKQEQIWALAQVEKRREAKPTLQGFMYFCLAASELENRPWMIGNPFYTINEFGNVLDIMPAWVSAMQLVVNYAKLSYDTHHAKGLMEQVYSDLTSKDMRDYEFVKKHKVPSAEEQLAANALVSYYERNKDDNSMMLPDLAGDDLFTGKFTVRAKGGTKEIDMTQLSEEEKSKVRNAAYKFLKEIWGKEDAVFMQQKDGSYAVNPDDSGLLAKVVRPKNSARKALAAGIGGMIDEDISTKIKSDEVEDQMTLNQNKYIVNHFYYSVKGYGHDKYDFKYKVTRDKNTPYLKSLIVATDPFEAFESNLWYMRGKR